MSTPLDDDALPASHSPGETAGNAWVDGADEPANLSPTDARRAADVTLLHALLEQALRPDAAAREIRVQRVAAAVRDTIMPAKPVTHPGRRRWLATLSTIAAVFVIGLMLRSSFNPKTNATAAVDTALKAATEEIDRAYHVTSDVLWPDGTPRVITADLWVRGGRHYVLRQDMPLGDLFLGSDGESNWVVPVIGPVLTGSEPGLLEQRLMRDQVALPFLQVTTLLERVADRYDVKLDRAVELATTDGVPAVWCTHIVGTKRDPADKAAPDVIRLWTARQSGVVQKIEMVWQPVDDQPGLRQITMTLQPIASDLPADWYQHTPHHTPDRRVIERGPINGNDGEL